MAYMRIVVQECKPGTVDMLTRKAEQSFVPRVRALPGFISYKVGKIDDHSLIALGIFETREGAEQLERAGVEWRKEVGKDAILSVKVYYSEITLDVGRDVRPIPTEARPSHPSA